MDRKLDFVMLSEQQIGILRAVINAIIPPDDDPGALEGGVETYLLRQFERDLSSFAAVYAQGLLAIDAEALALVGKHFIDLAPDSQEAMLVRIEQGNVQTDWAIDPVSFFAALVEHCAEGFYSDPGNGGNRDGAAWKMIGFEVTA